MSNVHLILLLALGCWFLIGIGFFLGRVLS